MDPLIISSFAHRDRCFLFSWHKLCGSLAHLASVCCYNGTFPSDVMLQFLTASTGRQYYHLAFLRDTSLILQNLSIHPGIVGFCCVVVLPQIHSVCLRMGNWYQWHDLLNIIVMTSDKADTWAKIWVCFHISTSARIKNERQHSMTCLLRESRVPMHRVWLQLQPGPRMMMLLCRYAGSWQGTRAAAQGGTSCSAGPPPAARFHRIWPAPCTHRKLQGFCRERKPLSMNFINKTGALSN